MRCKHKYGNASQVTDHFADGGVVKKDKMAKRAKKAKKNMASEQPHPEMLGKGMAGKAGKSLRSRRKEQMDKLGL